MSQQAILLLNGPSYGSALGSMNPRVTDHRQFLKNPTDFRLVLFTGGSDVTPELYGHTSPKNLCYCDALRDGVEKKVFETALKNNIPMAGICRGLQFINVMAGGTLVHHLDGHEGANHYMECQRDEKVIKVNSLHHQMVIPPKDAYVVGWCPVKLSRTYYGDKDELMSWSGPEIEAVVYPEIRAFGVQYHPEMMDRVTDGFKFFFDMLYDIMYKSLDHFVEIYTGTKKAYM